MSFIKLSDKIYDSNRYKKNPRLNKACNLLASLDSNIGDRFKMIKKVQLFDEAQISKEDSLQNKDEWTKCLAIVDAVSTLQDALYNKMKKDTVERVDLRHRLLFSFPHYNNVLEIEKEVDCLSVDTRNEFDQIKLFFITYFKSLLSFKQEAIVEFLEGVRPLNLLGINRENAASFLKLVKTFDLALIWQTRISRTKILFKNSTFEIRTRILELLSPEMHSSEAFTYTLDPKKLKNADYLKNPANWMPERIRFYASMILPQEFIKMISLSNRFNHDQPRVYALRGITASGKTSLIKQRFVRAVDEDGKLSGSLNPDNMKMVLQSRTAQKKLTGIQVHEEVVRGPLSSYKQAILHIRKFSILLDTCLSSNEDFANGVVEAAKARNGYATVIDLDVPLHLSMNRVLNSRNPWQDPNVVPSKVITQALREMTLCRRGIIESVKSESVVDQYELLSANADGDYKLVAEKKGLEFRMFSIPYLKSFQTFSLNAEIDQKMRQLTDTLPWKGIDLDKALDYHSLGITPGTAIQQIKSEEIVRKQFGSVTLFPFTNSWLSDFPQIKDHIDSEHLLHITGADENGVGLHWRTNKFSSNLNPQFNPEAHNGFQMKVGYFILSPSQVNTFRSSSLSETILKELEIKSSTGELLGYRFFVHPEAYLHFQALLNAKIPFVTSEQSEFIGTPTSSYRSWVLRHVVEKNKQFIPHQDSIPFIVKLGVTGSGDTSRLLPKSEVEKSIKEQIHFDKMVIDPKVMIFKETFGISLRHILNYPSKTSVCDIEPVDSGMIIREFPLELLKGKCRIHSFSALMSVERAKHPGICSLDGSTLGQDRLPLIYELISNAIKKGVVKTPTEFIQRFLIDEALLALESLVFKEGLSLPLHGQNLCIVLDNNNLPAGIAIRDHGDIHRVDRYLETYTWFYRHHIFSKLMNVVTASNGYHLPAIVGAPTQIGFSNPLQERSINYYLRNSIVAARTAIDKISITFKDYERFLAALDKSYLTALARYFDLSNTSELQVGKLPAAEIDSAGSMAIFKLNKKLWAHRKPVTGYRLANSSVSLIQEQESEKEFIKVQYQSIAFMGKYI